MYDMRAENQLLPCIKYVVCDMKEEIKKKEKKKQKLQRTEVANGNLSNLIVACRQQTINIYWFDWILTSSFLLLLLPFGLPHEHRQTERQTERFYAKK